MTNVDLAFAVWAGVMTGICYYQHKTVMTVGKALLGARQMMHDVADKKIELYKVGEELKWRKMSVLD